MRPEDLTLIPTIGRPALRGDLLLVDVAWPDLAADEQRGAVWRVPLDRAEGGPGDPEEWTRGERDSAPRVSPDGRWVAFLRKGAKGRPQLHVIPTGGGEARRLTDLPLGVGSPVWAPDSRRIAFVARVPEPGRYGTEEGVGPEAEAPRRITRLTYRLDDVGFLLDRPTQLFVVDAAAEDPAPRQLTTVPTSVSGPAWTPDGLHLVVETERDGERPEDSLHSDLLAVPADGGDATTLVRTHGRAEHPVVTEDGVLLYLGSEFEGIHAVARNTGLWAVPLRLGEECVAEAAPRRLTDVETVDCEQLAGPPVPMGDGVVVAVRDRGAVELRRVPLDAEGATLADLPVLVGERAAVRAFEVDGDRIAAVVSTPETPGEVVLVEAGGAARTLTNWSAPLRAAGVRPAREITATAPDGYPVHGWLVAPEGEGPHPVLLCVHGGPFQYHGWGFFDEAQVYAAAGYAVVLPNPRGSAGYGQEHGRAVIGGFGTVDVDDVLALLNAALERPECDAERVGVMGGSYGGLLTTWLAAHHGHRFRAAWSERAVNAWDSFRGSSDIGWWFADAYCGPDPEAQRAMSPLTHAHRIRIPFAVVHSEADWRCPVEQAQRLFVALRLNGVAAEMVLFPGEGHELTRSGRPRHRRQRFDLVLEWWERHLLGRQK
ncbi:Dipeptidyl aminopeptidase/acylaminoacyl peptidase [Streptoalloteichus tenebrarius]|uniref:Dipeptidyl aminopeptidase/acylaminoacyl peptidase n=1 Tax=Streptoalloteichus tenebrarius (strain ATCC 17920 / DSM 40477 / JCM 4838 / CBS 697.72 / NBRC 16177 / NCIMB 11028 / NRRL B-12390 / A12253. 1 / ISP 5477) TaxID=1933 RepID=A0ABT1HSP5_STRSD|nr:S9 family peptidase [Streptoalloteichus tenebrarius]MCP2258440.1 Dipeptidyl aminopeptidase/acylaminoacyl peptidase [Streptoalloteichus tenebrarius]